MLVHCLAMLSRQYACCACLRMACSSPALLPLLPAAEGGREVDDSASAQQQQPPQQQQQQQQAGSGQPGLEALASELEAMRAAERGLDGQLAALWGSMQVGGGRFAALGWASDWHTALCRAHHNQYMQLPVLADTVSSCTCCALAWAPSC